MNYSPQITDTENDIVIYLGCTPDIQRDTSLPSCTYYIPYYSTVNVRVAEKTNDSTQQEETRFKTLRVYTDDASSDDCFIELYEKFPTYPPIYYWSIFVENMKLQSAGKLYIELTLVDDTVLKYEYSLTEYSYETLTFDSLEIVQTDILGTKYHITGVITAKNTGKLPMYPYEIIPPGSDNPPKPPIKVNIYQDEIDGTNSWSLDNNYITSLGDNQYKFEIGAFPSVEQRLLNPQKLIFEILDQPGNWLQENITGWHSIAGEKQVNSLTDNRLIRDIYYDTNNDELKFGYGTAASTIGSDPVEHFFNGTVGCNNVQAYDGTSGFEDVDVLNDLKVEHKLTIENDSNVPHSFDVHHINSNDVEEGGFIYGTTYSSSVGLTVGTKNSNGEVIKQCTMTEEGIDGSSAKVRTTSEGNVAKTYYPVMTDNNNTQANNLYESGYFTMTRNINDANAGYLLLSLGNNIASGSANNARGYLRLYGTGQYYTQMTPSNITSNKTINIHDAAGNMLIETNHTGTAGYQNGSWVANVMGTTDTANKDNFFVLSNGLMICWGRRTVTPTANAVKKTQMTFPNSGYSSIPYVFVSCESTVPYSQVRYVSVSEVTNTNCYLNIYRTNTDKTNIWYFAIGKK